MANRDVALGLCGGVVGVLLGTGSVLFAQEVSLSASAVDQVAAVYLDLNTADTEDAKARNVQRRVLEKQAEDNARAMRKAARAKEQEGTHESAPAQPASSCDVARNLTQRMGLAIQTAIPVQQEFERFTDPLYVVLDNIEKDYCDSFVEEDAAAQAAMESAVPMVVDNDCEQYIEGSRRKTLCVANEREGIPYIGN